MSKEVQKKPIIVAQIMGKWVGGGVESVIMNYYRHLDHSKVQFDFICDEDSTRIPYDEIKKLGGRVFLVPKYQNLPKYLKALEKLFKENQYRIVHSNINTLSVFPLYAAKKAGVPIRISHSHSTSNPKEWKRNLIKNILRPFSKRYATDYFACSELAGRYLFGNKAFDQGEVKIIHNAIDIDKFKFDEVARKKLRKEFGIKDSTVVIGHVGRFVQQKNHTFLVDVFKEYHKKNPDSKLLLVGSGPLEDEIKRKVKRLGLDDSVFFLGQRDDTNKLYSVMDIFCLPSLYEGLPVVGVESQAAGLPIIFSNGVSHEAIISKNAKIVPTQETGAYIKKMDEITQENKQRALASINENMSIKNEAPKLEAIYCRPLKVLHLISTSLFSGAENVACQIINLFKDESSYDMRYCAVIGKNKEALEIRKIPVLKLDKFNIHDIKKAIKEYNPDIIHAHDPKSTIASVISSRGKKIIAHIHSNHRYMRKISIKSCIFHFYIEKRTSDIIWVSDSALNEYIFNKKNNKKINSIVLRNVVNPNELKDIAINDKNKYSFDLVFLGRMEDVKNPLRFIDIMSQIQKNKRDIKVAMIGDGSLMNEVKTKVNELGLEKNTTIFCNLINPYKILLSSKILVITSRYEGTPMNALESIACGIPIVSTPVDGLLEIINKKYLCSTDKDFIKIITMLLNDNGLYNKYNIDLITINNRINVVSIYKRKITALYN
ncbi:glycosyltransferase [Candidatus Saccharibacteria bacterium]|nr:glycosyltransferase [Candidatus Saccharibacteria bacterium]